MGVTLDGRADLYAVGVMLYQMLTGKIPRGRFDPPSGVVTEVNQGFDAIVDKAMQTDREKRYSTAIELKTDLERVAFEVGAAEKHQRGRAKPKHRSAIFLTRLIISLATFVVLGGGAYLIIRQNPTTISSSPLHQVSNPFSPFPPGQWVRPFRRATDINAGWFKDGAKWEDGWITGGSGTNHGITLAAPNGRGQNWGVRARYRWNSGGFASIVLRRNGSSPENTVALYELRVEKGNAYFRRSAGRGSSGSGGDFFPLGVPVPVALKEGEDIVVEAFAISNRLHGKVNGVVVRAESDGLLTEGGFEACAHGMTYSEIEFINLDGLREEEARTVAEQPDAISNGS